MCYVKLKMCWREPAIVKPLLMKTQTLVAGDELIFPTSRMLRGFARSGAEVVLISHRPEALESATKNG